MRLVRSSMRVRRVMGLARRRLVTPALLAKLPARRKCGTLAKLPARAPVARARARHLR